MKVHLKARSQFLLLMICAYAMLFEWRSIFERPYFIFTANLLKAIIPAIFTLLLLKIKRFSGYPALRSYVLFFFLFMVWGLASSLLSSELNECIAQWLKYAPLFLFCYFICLYALINDHAMGMIMKSFVYISIFTSMQYIILVVVSFYGPADIFNNPTIRGGLYRGPFGLLGQGSGSVYFSQINLSLFQLYGFWLEPGNAAGFLLASAFFADIIFLQTKQKIWKIAKFICFIGCIATFSNTAYLCIGMIGLLGELFNFKTSKNRRFFHFTIVVLFIIFSFAAVFGRYFVAKYYADNFDLRYVAGVRNSVKDPYGGRIELFNSNLADLKANPLLGKGFRIPGKDEHGRGYVVSSHAPGYWLAFTGIIGIMLLMLREFQLIKEIAKNIFSSIYILRVSQAWLAIFISNLTYGTLMSPFYLITVAIVFSSIYHFKKRGNIG
jgi:hypothetical protein